MNFIPYESIKLKSSLKKDAISSRVFSELEHTTLFGMATHRNSLKKYEGFVDNGKFKFRRILKTGINSFIPIVEGEVDETEDGTIITLKIRLHYFVYILLAIITLFSISTLSFGPSWSAILFICAPYLICIFFYNQESSIVKDDLMSMLKE